MVKLPLFGRIPLEMWSNGCGSSCCRWLGYHDPLLQLLTKKAIDTQTNALDSQPKNTESLQQILLNPKLHSMLATVDFMVSRVMSQAGLTHLASQEVLLDLLVGCSPLVQKIMVNNRSK